MVKIQKVQVKRVRALLKHKGIDRSSFDKEVAKLQSYQAQLAGADARAASARFELEHTQIKSPIKGQVEQRLLSLGDFIQPGQALFKLVNTEQLRAKIIFSEAHALEVKIGDPVLLFSPVENQTPLAAKIDYIRPNINLDTRSIDAFASFSNTHHWRVGNSVDVRIITKIHPHALTLPSRTVMQRRAGQAVYVLKGKRVKEVLVQTGMIEKNRTEIMSGLRADQKVVLDGAGFLSDGMTVNVISDKSMHPPARLVETIKPEKTKSNTPPSVKPQTEHHATPWPKTVLDTQQGADK